MEFVKTPVSSYIAISQVNGDPEKKAKDMYAILEDLMKLRQNGKCSVPKLWKGI